MSIHWPILRQLLAHPKRVAIVDDRRSYTGIELLVASWHLAAHLAPLCQTKTIGLLLPTSGAFPIAALAGWWLGKTIVPINYLLKPEEMNYIVRDCGCDTVVTVQAMLDFLGSSADECLYAPEGGGGGPPTAVKNVVRIEDISFKGLPDPMWPAGAGDDDLAVLLYTSGTSGKPKGVMLTHGNIKANARQVKGYAQFTSKDVMLGVLPQFHSFGITVLTLLPLRYGLKVVYTARFVPGKILGLLNEHRPTIFIGIPSMYNALLHAKTADAETFKSLRYIVSGGEPLPDAVFEGFRERFGVTINEGYGLTETSPVTNWCRPDEWRRGSVGPVLPEMEQIIVDPDTGRRLGPNADGEVRMKGPNVMRGYYHLPQETASVFDAQGYFRTGDIGRHDLDGHLFITGRLKEMLIVAGENVFPREIEEVLNKHPSIKASGVVGKQDPMRGELPVAFVELREGVTNIAENEVRSFVRQHIAGYKVPDEIRVVPELPRNGTGKVMRRELKKMV